MKAKTYVVERQIAWAKRKGIPLVDNPRSRKPVGEFRGLEYRTAYTSSLDDNLFEPMSQEVRADFQGGDGDELGEKMKALYSSSALACNLFHFLRSTEQRETLANVLGLQAQSVQAVRYEQKRPVMENPRSKGFQRDPNLDVAISCGAGKHRETAIECKFLEPWRDKPSGLKTRWLDTAELWTEFPSCRALAERIGTGDLDSQHQHLHAAQLLKHLLGLAYENREGGKASFELIYLWYDVPAPEGRVHGQEVSAFAKAVEEDGIRFRAISCQQLILRLLQHRSKFQAPVDYLADRYL